MKFPIAGLLFILTAACAKIGTPSGGPEDVNPPEYMSGMPENRSTGFKGDQIDINFNEYIQLKDQNKEVVISPPTSKKPLIRVREKSIRVTFNEDLLPETTYTINFGRAISDINEGNALPDFEYVFSTGNTIDSLSVTGNVVDAFSSKPLPEGSILVMLYDDLSDSAPLLKIPKYYGKTNKFGLFAVNNLNADTFRIVAVKDANNNLKYEPGIETIAFLDSFLIVNVENVKPQIFIKDTIKIITPAVKKVRMNRQDTAHMKADTVIAPGRSIKAVNVFLRSFIEENEKVFITDRKRDIRERFSIAFNRPLYDSLEIIPLNFSPVRDWYLSEASSRQDSITFWIKDSAIYKADTLQMALRYLTIDSTGLLSHRTDTVKLRLALPMNNERAARRNRNTEEKPKKETLVLSGEIPSRGMLDLNKDIGFKAGRPLIGIDQNQIEMYHQKDSLMIPQSFRISFDTNAFRRFRILTNLEEDSKYHVLFKPGSAYDIYGRTNDSIQYDFTTPTLDYYGKIFLDLSAPDYPMIIQITDEKGTVVMTKTAHADGVVSFELLHPGKYSLKAIYDANSNGKWDTGKYLKHIQPEKVYVSSKLEMLRSNWELEPQWTITE